VQRRVGDAELLARRAITRRRGGQDRIQVGLGNLVAHDLAGTAKRQVQKLARGRGGRRDGGVDGRHDLRAVGPVQLDPVVTAGLWLAVTITPALARRCRTAKASTGVGTGPSSRSTRRPAPVSTAAASSANSREPRRAS